MAEPQTLRAAVEIARKRELIWGEGEREGVAGQPEVNAAAIWAPGMAKPEWMDELGSLVKAASLVIEQGPLSAGVVASLATFGESVTNPPVAREMTTGSRTGGSAGPPINPRTHSKERRHPAVRPKGWRLATTCHGCPHIP